MKKVLSVLLVFACLASLCACHKEPIVVLPEISDIHNICNLATVECYYHNVGTGEKEKGTGFLHLLDSDQECWIEYSGTATLGIDASKVSTEIKGNEVVVSIPKASVLRIGYDEKQSFTIYSTKKNALQDAVNSNKISAEDKADILKVAQEKMEATVNADTRLLKLAQDKAKELIENYINEIGRLSDVEYTIVWKDIE